MIVDVRERGGHAERKKLAFVAQCRQRLDGAVAPQGLERWADVQLHEVESIGAQPPQALLDARADVRFGVVVDERPWRRVRLEVQRAARLRCEHVFVAARPDVGADAFLAQRVVDRGVDEPDALVQHRVEDLGGDVLVERARVAMWGAAEFHGAEPEHGDRGPGAAQSARFQLTHNVLLLFRISCCLPCSMPRMREINVKSLRSDVTRT